MRITSMGTSHRGSTSMLKISAATSITRRTIQATRLPIRRNTNGIRVSRKPATILPVGALPWLNGTGAIVRRSEPR